jgi:hypothetical protein
MYTPVKNSPECRESAECANFTEQRMFRPLAIALLTSMLAAIATAQDGKIPFQAIPLPPTLGLPDGHTNFVIRSAEEWYVWTNRLSEIDEPLPTVDFARYTALVASAGYKEHGPVVMIFDSVTDTGNVIRVHVSVTTPASCPAQPVSGHYAVIALIPRTDKPIQFDVSNRDTSCPYR